MSCWQTKGFEKTNDGQHEQAVLATRILFRFVFSKVYHFISKKKKIKNKRSINRLINFFFIVFHSLLKTSHRYT